MNTTRKYWLDTMLKIVTPAIEALANDRLKQDMPVDSVYAPEEYEYWEYLEILGRITTSIAPWLACKGLEEEEEKLRVRYAELMRKCITIAVDPEAKDHVNFVPQPYLQPIVDAAFLAQGILRAPEELWDPLDDITKTRVLEHMRMTRVEKPGQENWLLFSAIIECLLHYAGADDWDPMRIDYALYKHMDWYCGDSWYGDGPHFQTDYYNSYVIHPMLVDVLREVGDCYPDWQNMRSVINARASRFATYQEHLIAPDGTYPPMGRSLAYRFGAFHCLAQMSYLEMLEDYITPAQVRCALTAVIQKVCSSPDMFDEKGWLRIGVYGYQPDIAEVYISTASLYFCAVVFLPLGLNQDAAFWKDEDKDWSSKALWSGVNMKTVYALD